MERAKEKSVEEWEETGEGYRTERIGRGHNGGLARVETTKSGEAAANVAYYKSLLRRDGCTTGCTPSSIHRHDCGGLNEGVPSSRENGAPHRDSRRYPVNSGKRV